MASITFPHHRYEPPKKEWWQGRKDGAGITRFHDIIHLMDLAKEVPDAQMGKTFCFIGFCSDEGVRRNQGRVGAFQGPLSLRKALANLPCNLSEKPNFVDCGNILCNDGCLEESQEALGLIVKSIQDQGAISIVLGGGHEVAFGHYLGINGSCPGKRIGIINFDAHFDLRPLLEGGKGSSGTSFTQIAMESKKAGHPFSYACIGIQTLGNTKDLFDQAKTLGVSYVTAEEIHLEGITKAKQLIDHMVKQSDLIYLTICLDVFAAPFAPGVSAPQPLGLLPWQMIPLIKQIARSGTLSGLDLAELAPCVDRDDCTAKLGAMLISAFIHEGF